PSTGPVPGANAAAPAAGVAPPGDEYFVEAPPQAAPVAAGAPTEAPFEPPLPLESSFEPPPPPQVRHVAPLNSLWLGVRLGWFFPFGNAWARAKPVTTSAGTGYVLEGVPWRDYASSGPM